MSPRHLGGSAQDFEQLMDEHRKEVAQRAEAAQQTVLRLMTSRALGVPGTLLGKVQHPETRSRWEQTKNWHYWWQAHLLDALVDAGFRQQAAGNQAAAQQRLDQGRALLRGIQLRNLGGFVNSFYDDMAWLTLACERLNRLSLALTGSGEELAQEAASSLYRQLEAGLAPGGGIFWSKDRDFVNVPATAPAALAFARAGRFEMAAGLLNWLAGQLLDDETGLYLDGIKLGPDGQQRLERALYTYNQGPVLGAYLALLDAGQTDLLSLDAVEHVSQLVAATDRHFGRDFALPGGESLRVLATQGAGDGGLFTGILVRYLTQVAQHPSLPEATRQLARELVTNTAELFWEGRREFDPDLPLNEPGIDPSEIRGQAVVLFSPDVERHISDVLKPGQPVELSSQVQAWMSLEAAARIF